MKNKTTAITDVEGARLLVLRSALKLECLGMKRRGESAYAIVKREFGLKGSKVEVLAQFDVIVKGETGI